MSQKNSALLLGGEGFIGKNITDTIQDKFNCTTVSLLPSPFITSKVNFIKTNPYMEILNGKFDVYIHLIDHQADLDDINNQESELTKNLNIPKSSHLILFSSSVIYANPSSDYAKRKLKLEQVYENYCSSHDINLTILRLFNTYGNYQLPYRQGSLIANILFNHIHNLPTEINDLETKRDYIYAGDIGKIVQHIIDNQYFGKVDIGSGELVSIKQLLNILEKDVIKDKINIIDKKQTENITCPIANGTLTNAITPTSLTDGLTQTYLFYKQNRDIIKQYLK